MQKTILNKTVDLIKKPWSEYRQELQAKFDEVEAHNHQEAMKVWSSSGRYEANYRGIEVTLKFPNGQVRKQGVTPELLISQLAALGLGKLLRQHPSREEELLNYVRGLEAPQEQEDAVFRAIGKTGQAQQKTSDLVQDQFHQPISDVLAGINDLTIESVPSLTTTQNIPARGRYHDGVISINTAVLNGSDADAIGVLAEEYGEHLAGTSQAGVDLGAIKGKQLIQNMIAEAASSPDGRVRVKAVIEGRERIFEATADELSEVVSSHYTDQRIHQPQEDSAGRYQLERALETAGQSMNIKNKPPPSAPPPNTVDDLKVWRFNVNNETISSPDRKSTYSAFSGADGARGDPGEERNPGGPIPRGRYFIVDRPAGEGVGGIIRTVGRAITDEHPFALYKDDGKIDDYTTFTGMTVYEGQPVQYTDERGNFRLHGGTRSEGCVTMTREEYAKLRAQIEEAPRAEIMDASTNKPITTYGILIVEGEPKPPPAEK